MKAWKELAETQPKDGDAVLLMKKGEYRPYATKIHIGGITQSERYSFLWLAIPNIDDPDPATAWAERAEKLREALEELHRESSCEADRIFIENALENYKKETEWHTI